MVFCRGVASIARSTLEWGKKTNAKGCHFQIPDKERKTCESNDFNYRVMRPRKSVMRDVASQTGLYC